jgi:hypothetical protein
MSKWLAWFMMIPICLLAHYFMMMSFLVAAEGVEQVNPLAIIVVTPFFLMINLIFHLFALFKGIAYGKNPGLFTCQSFFRKGVLKYLGSALVAISVLTIIDSIRLSDYLSLSSNLLRGVIILFYWSWFNTFRFRA